jgi:hypothetical protein
MRVHVRDELIFERICPFVRHRRGRGFGRRRVEVMTERLIHRDIGRGHAGCGLEEAAARQSLLLGEIVSKIKEPRLQFALLVGLRIRIIFVARYDLGGDRRLVRQQLRRRELLAVVVAQKSHDLLLAKSPRLRGF